MPQSLFKLSTLRYPTPGFTFFSIKPSEARFNEWARMKTANDMIREFAGSQQRVQYIDVGSAMLDAQENLPYSGRSASQCEVLCIVDFDYQTYAAKAIS